MDKTHYEDFEQKYEEMARELNGYDDGTLLREAAAAECEWQQLKNNHSDEVDKVEQKADQDFECLMQRVRLEGLRPVSERRYKRRQRRETGGIVGIQKINKKAMILVLAAVVLVIGGSIGVMARNGYRYNSYPEQENKNKTEIYNTVLIIKEDKVEKVYDIVKEKIGVPVLIPDYVPQNMSFNKLTLNDNYAVFEFEYDGKYIYLKEERLTDNNKSIIRMSDRQPIHKVENYWINECIGIEENELDNGVIEYSASIQKERAYYYLSGIMEYNEFAKIVENLCFSE